MLKRPSSDVSALAVVDTSTPGMQCISDKFRQYDVEVRITEQCVISPTLAAETDRRIVRRRGQT